MINHLTFGPQHLMYMMGCLLFWILIPWLGRFIKTPEYKRLGALILATVTIGQELVFDLYQIVFDQWVFSLDFSLHMCGLSLFISAYALWTKNQTAFEISYFWGLAGALQAIITPDSSRWPYGELSVFWNYLSHGIIILNVLWLVFVENMRCRKGTYLNIIFITNGTAFIMGYLNALIGNGANFWFMNGKPGGESPFLIGEWPLYLISFEMAMFLVMGIVYLPMVLSSIRKKAIHP